MAIGGGIWTENAVFDILRTLPVKSLLRFTSVSKSWNQLITDPFFATSHLQFHKQPTLSSSSQYGPNSQSLLGITINRDYHGNYHEEQFEYFRIDNAKKTTLEHLKIPFPWKKMLNPKPQPRMSKDDVTILGHCNGLVFVLYAQTILIPQYDPQCTRYLKLIGYEKIDLDRFIICNPITRRFKILPESNLELPTLTLEDGDAYYRHWVRKEFNAVGFGFVDNLSYKVVSLTYGAGKKFIYGDEEFLKPYEPVIVDVYDSRSDSWRRVLDVDTDFSYEHLDNGVYNSFDGRLYWLGSGAGKMRRRYSTLVSFHLVEERMQEILLPYKYGYVDYYSDRVEEDGDVVNYVFGKHGVCECVEVLGESVVMMVLHPRNHLVRSFWKMNRAEDDNISWTHIFRLNFGGPALGFCRNGELLLMKTHGLGEEDYRKLFLYDSNKMNDSSFGFTDLDFNVVSTVPNFVESLLLLDGESEVVEDESEETVHFPEETVHFPEEPRKPRKSVWEEDEDFEGLGNLFEKRNLQEEEAGEEREEEDDDFIIGDLFE